MEGECFMERVSMIGILSHRPFASTFDTWTSRVYLCGDAWLGGHACYMKICGVSELAHVGYCTWVLAWKSVIGMNGYVTTYLLDT